MTITHVMTTTMPTTMNIPITTIQIPRIIASMIGIVRLLLESLEELTPDAIGIKRETVPPEGTVTVVVLVLYLTDVDTDVDTEVVVDTVVIVDVIGGLVM